MKYEEQLRWPPLDGWRKGFCKLPSRTQCVRVWTAPATWEAEGRRSLEDWEPTWATQWEPYLHTHTTHVWPFHDDITTHNDSECFGFLAYNMKINYHRCAVWGSYWILQAQCQHHQKKKKLSKHASPRPMASFGWFVVFICIFNTYFISELFVIKRQSLKAYI